MHLDLKHLTKPSYIHIFLYLLLGIVLWGITFFSDYFTLGSPDAEFMSIPKEELLINLLVFGITIVNAALLSQLLTLFSFVNSRSFIGVIVFFLLITTWKATHLLYISHITLFLFIIGVFQFLMMPHNEKPSEKSFLGALFLGIASLLVKDIVFLLPFCWVGFLILHTLNLRTFLASLLGLIVPHILFLSANYIFSFMANPYELYQYDFNVSLTLPDFSLFNWIYIALLVTILIIILISTYSEFNKKSIHTRRNLNFMVLMLSFFIITSLLYSNTSILFLPIIGFLYAVLFNHSLSIKKSNFYSILFVIFCIINITVILYNFIF